jgi:miniconductance mechanosensitive channel
MKFNFIKINFNSLIQDTLLSSISNAGIRSILGATIVLVSLLLVAWIIDKILRSLIINRINHSFISAKSHFLRAVSTNRVLNVLSLLIFAFVLDFGSALIDATIKDKHVLYLSSIITQAAFILYFVLVSLILTRILSTINDYYEYKFGTEYEIPIYGYVKMLQVGVWILATILYASFILNKSPIVVLTGVGAVSAVVLFIFKDAILGLIASIQATANQIVKLGDWVIIPKFNANGVVIDVSLTIIKVQNWDNTVTSVPTVALTTDSVQNWMPMFKSGGRRIMRAINIDINSIKVCDNQLFSALYDKYFQNFSDGELLKIQYGEKSNLALFRLYLINYIEHHPDLNSDLLHFVRYLEPTQFGVPLQIWAFTKGVDIIDYEATQSEVFEHVFIACKDFELKIFQFKENTIAQATI